MSRPQSRGGTRPWAMNPNPYGVQQLPRRPCDRKSGSYLRPVHEERRSPESCSSSRSSEEPHAGFTTVVHGCLRSASLGVLSIGSLRVLSCITRRCRRTEAARKRLQRSVAFCTSVIPDSGTATSFSLDFDVAQIAGLAGLEL